MNQSLLVRTFAQWIVKGLLVLMLLLAALGAGLAYATHTGHGPDVAPGGCSGCNHYTMVGSSSENRASTW